MQNSEVSFFRHIVLNRKLIFSPLMEASDRCCKNGREIIHFFREFALSRIFI